MHASIEHIKELYDYLVWADRLTLDAGTGVVEGEYHRERPISSGSIHKLLVHVMAAEWVWLTRWRGSSPARIENQEDYPTRAALEARWPQVHAELLAFVDKQTDDSVGARLHYRHTGGEDRSVTLGHAMIHVVDHSSYHRGQLNSMIKQAGGVPATASYITFKAHRPGED
ncbi:MAG TPA: DinB family protein [Isosphaeraceae bacterium]|jgi:uncharacterized damage-inducible protein DinB|nr:DinB family protein [Isosphaeraceae bacterium]